MRIGIGLGLGPDGFAAAAQAARQAKAAVPRPDLALAFGSIRLDQRRVNAGLLSELDPGTLLGGSSYAEITNAGVTQGSVAVLLIETEAKIGFSQSKLKVRPMLTGRALARPHKPARNGALRVGLMVSALRTGRESDLLTGLESRLGRFPVFGGICSGDYDAGLSDRRFFGTYQYGKRLSMESARLALLDLPKPQNVAFGFEHGWQPVGPPVRITRTAGDRVYEVDGMPVLDFYRQFIGRDVSGDFFEKMIQRYAFSMVLEDRGEKRSILKLPVRLSVRSGWVSYYPVEDLKGKTVQLIQSSRVSLIDGARKAAESCRRALNGRPDLVLVVSCCTRKAILHSKMDSEIAAIRRVFGNDVPIFGYYSGGEITPYLSRCADISDVNKPLSGSRYHTTTVGVMAISSGKPVRALVPPRVRTADGDAAELRRQLAASEKILDSTEAFMTNLSRKAYLDGERLKKQNDVIFRYTPHKVWERVKESVSQGVYELEDRDFKGAFLFMDVKGYTHYSEGHSPKQVVAALNKVFGRATDIIYEEDGDVDKYIGDCIFAAFPDALSAARAGGRITSLLEDLHREGVPFELRIGVNAGRAVRANVGSASRREYTFIGDAVNLAQRLESNCTPGRMLLSAQAYRAAKRAVRLVEARTIQVKGKARPIKVFECAAR